MTPFAAVALALLLPATKPAAKPGINLSFSSDDSHVTLGARHDARDARFAITTREGAASMMILRDVVAVQLTDATLAHIEPGNDAGFIEELLVSGVRLALKKAIEIPISDLRSVEYRDGGLVFTNIDNKPVFTAIKVNGTDILRDFTAQDAVRFVNAFRAAKAQR